MAEPEFGDLQLTIDGLKASVRDAQRMASELRNELEARRQDLADARLARAQLEGRVREAERRVAESKQVIELQREELSTARVERERLSRSSFHMQSQLKQLQRQLSKIGKSSEEGQEPVLSPASNPARKAQKAVMGPTQIDTFTRTRPERKAAATPAGLVQMPITKEAAYDREQEGVRSGQVFVKSGDTLWSIAHAYHVDLNQLRAANQLTDNRIFVGQALRLPVRHMEHEDSVPAP